jgi:prepilin-type N-terminal cleavage/methylation domain-containing protein
MTNLFARRRRAAGFALLERLRRDAGGFTLIELLVAIAIIAILIGILLPGLGHARKVGRMTEEQARLHDTSTAYLTYANDYQDAFIPGYSHWAWAHATGFGDPNYQNRVDMRGRDFERRVIEGYCSKVWPWRFFNWVKEDMRGLMIDKNVYTEFLARPGSATTGTDGPTGLPSVDPGSGSKEGAFAWHPSWGINGVYVGGHHMYGAFTSPNGYRGTSVNAPYGEFFATRVSQVQFSSKLITMASSRRYDVRVQGFGSDNDSGVAASTTIYHGSHDILPPYPFPTGRLSQTVGGRGGYSYDGGGWTSPDSQSNKFDAKKRPSTWGFIDPRHFETACVTTVDGHVEQLNLEQLRDSTRWANQAKNKTWQP